MKVQPERISICMSQKGVSSCSDCTLSEFECVVEILRIINGSDNAPCGEYVPSGPNNDNADNQNPVSLAAESRDAIAAAPLVNSERRFKSRDEL
ncbi:MAG: hypothetical protein FWD93_03145 [Coriobacteriia bacterium]|nr:hypothetical protein [Coriobacteriia bacterium]